MVKIIIYQLYLDKCIYLPGPARTRPGFDFGLKGAPSFNLALGN
uniref:Uncharacterized protein n=1 Tax=Schistosoma curassoni TaxID=6186 RepID=A0A183K2W6_9TREM